MELEGIRINDSFLKNYSSELEGEIAILEKRIIELAGVPFNIASPKQLGEVLFEHLKLDPKAKQSVNILCESEYPKADNNSADLKLFIFSSNGSPPATRWVDVKALTDYLDLNNDAHLGMIMLRLLEQTGFVTIEIDADCSTE